VNAAADRTSLEVSVSALIITGAIAANESAKPSAHPSATMPSTATAACLFFWSLASPIALDANAKTSGNTCFEGAFRESKSTNRAATVWTWMSSSEVSEG
jgi:hypothetical protein